MPPSPESGPGPAAGRSPLAIAHRGRHDAHVENTLEAFRAAYDSGCDMVEFDVQLSRDGVPFIFHDDDGTRLTGRREMVYDLDWSELKEWVMHPGPAGQAYGYRLPTLEQFLREFGSRPFYLEMKVPKARQRDEAYLRKLGEQCSDMVKSSSPRPETILASFHIQLLSLLSRAGAHPSLVGIFESLDRFRDVLDSKSQSLERYSLAWKVYRGYQKSAAPRILGKLDPSRVILWDIKGEADMESARAEGIYGLCADEVDTMLRICRGA